MIIRYEALVNVEGPRVEAPEGSSTYQGKGVLPPHEFIMLQEMHNQLAERTERQQMLLLQTQIDFDGLAHARRALASSLEK